jgi:hypothetical protein
MHAMSGTSGASSVVHQINAYPEDQKYKIGKVILELHALGKEDGWDTLSHGSDESDTSE